MGSVILTGDAVNCRDNIATDTPGGITSDSTAAVMSMHRLTALANVMDASMLVSHDLESFAALPKAPEPLTRLSDEAKAFCKHGIETVYQGISDPRNLI